MRSVSSLVVLGGLVLLPILLASCGQRPVQASDVLRAGVGAEQVLPRGYQEHCGRVLRGIEDRMSRHLANLENIDTVAYKRVTADGGHDFQAGVINGTQRPLDLAIAGEGFFVVQAANGEELYTRNGHLLLDANGRLSTGSGHVLQPEVVVPQTCTAIGVAPDGTVTVTTSGKPDETRQVARIKLVRFVDPTSLQAVSPSVFRVSSRMAKPIHGDPASDGFGELAQNFLERSNVERTPELVALHVLTRRWRAIAQAARFGPALLELGPPGVAEYFVRNELTRERR